MENSDTPYIVANMYLISIVIVCETWFKSIGLTIGFLYILAALIFFYLGHVIVTFVIIAKNQKERKTRSKKRK